jgi:hypothetical protein
MRARSFGSAARQLSEGSGIQEGAAVERRKFLAYSLPIDRGHYAATN